MQTFLNESGAFFILSGPLFIQKSAEMLMSGQSNSDHGNLADAVLLSGWTDFVMKVQFQRDLFIRGSETLILSDLQRILQ